jgi:hypothetical protein
MKLGIMQFSPTSCHFIYFSLSLSLSLSLYIYIYTYVCVCVCIWVLIAPERLQRFY